MGKHFPPDHLDDYRARIEALFTPVVRGLIAEALAGARVDEAELEALGVAVPPGDPVSLGEMLLADCRDPEGMTRPEMVLALKGWARLKLAELRIHALAEAAAAPIRWSSAMTLAVCAKRFGAPNRRKVREHLDRIGVAWQHVGAKKMIRVDASKLPPAK